MTPFRSLIHATTVLLIAAGLVIGGCSLVSSDSASDEPSLVNVSTSEDTVRVARSTHDGATRIEFDVTAHFTSSLSDSLTMIGCPPPSLPLVERRTEDGWTVALSPIERMCLAKKRLAPGDTITVGGTYSAYLPGDHNNAPVFDGPIEGTYRLRIPRNDFEDAGGIPDDDLTSDTFQIRL
jgi:hypothetical protein